MNIQLLQSTTTATARACKGSATLHACPQHNTCCKYLYVQQILKNTANTCICSKYCKYYCPPALQLGPQLCAVLHRTAVQFRVNLRARNAMQMKAGWCNCGVCFMHWCALVSVCVVHWCVLASVWCTTGVYWCLCGKTSDS